MGTKPGAASSHSRFSIERLDFGRVAAVGGRGRYELPFVERGRDPSRTAALHWKSVPENESDLLEQAKRGNARAFEALIRPHVPVVRRFAYSFARDWQDADDLSQEALLKAFRSIDSFAGRSALSTWLFTVTRSVCLDWYRSRLARSRAEDDELGEDSVDSVEGQDSLLEQKSSAERLWRAIKQLDAEFRVPLVLHEIEGVSYEDIAHVERVPIGTIRSRLARGRAKLRALLAEPVELALRPSGARGAPLSSPRGSPVG